MTEKNPSALTTSRGHDPGTPRIPWASHLVSSYDQQHYCYTVSAVKAERLAVLRELREIANEFIGSDIGNTPILIKIVNLAGEMEAQTK